MQNDCYDAFGRMINITTGRASVAGSFRNRIEEKSWMEWNPSIGRRPRPIMEPSVLTGGSVIRPHYRPPKTSISMDASLRESSIEITLRVASDKSRSRHWEFTECIHAMLSGTVVPYCDHEFNSGYELQRDRELALEGFHIARFTNRSSDHILILALEGNKLEQLLACGMLIHEARQDEPKPKKLLRGVLQLSSCLRCSIRLAQQSQDHLPWVIVGG
ncbi:hypothetical protein CCHR01_03658 [Colletotrichum chrysophilum]|uniref:Uncharacterized protein n=1 Tax=Colletotrichum chrysophilum TaxID=1836956 RepID=A0AAD9ER57_9PEZI|nr:hypothetical protein CCHR01_03658 [Colletotrichum chrysophilum]